MCVYGLLNINWCLKNYRQYRSRLAIVRPRQGLVHNRIVKSLNSDTNNVRSRFVCHPNTFFYANARSFCNNYLGKYVFFFFYNWTWTKKTFVGVQNPIIWGGGILVWFNFQPLKTRPSFETVRTVLRSDEMDFLSHTHGQLRGLFPEQINPIDPGVVTAFHLQAPSPRRKPLKFHRHRRFFLNPYAYELCCVYDDGLFETKRNGRNDKLSQDSPMRRRRPYMFRVKFEIHNANIIRFVYFICMCICIRRAKFPHTSIIPV